MGRQIRRCLRGRARTCANVRERGARLHVRAKVCFGLHTANKRTLTRAETRRPGLLTPADEGSRTANAQRTRHEDAMTRAGGSELARPAVPATRATVQRGRQAGVTWRPLSRPRRGAAGLPRLPRPRHEPLRARRARATITAWGAPCPAAPGNRAPAAQPGRSHRKSRAAAPLAPMRGATRSRTACARASSLVARKIHAAVAAYSGCVAGLRGRAAWTGCMSGAPVAVANSAWQQRMTTKDDNSGTSVSARARDPNPSHLHRNLASEITELLVNRAWSPRPTPIQDAWPAA